MRRRSTNLLAFLTIYAVCIAGALHMSWWSAIAATCILVLVSLHNRWAAWSYVRTGALAVADPIQIAASTLNAAAVSAAGFMLGHAIAWLWGF